MPWWLIAPLAVVGMPFAMHYGFGWIFRKLGFRDWCQPLPYLGFCSERVKEVGLGPIDSWALNSSELVHCDPYGSLSFWTVVANIVWPVGLLVRISQLVGIGFKSKEEREVHRTLSVMAFREWEELQELIREQDRLKRAQEILRAKGIRGVGTKISEALDKTREEVVVHKIASMLGLSLEEAKLVVTQAYRSSLKTQDLAEADGQDASDKGKVSDR